VAAVFDIAAIIVFSKMVWQFMWDLFPEKNVEHLVEEHIVQ